MPPRRRAPAPTPIDVDAVRRKLAEGKIVRVGISRSAQFPDGGTGRVRHVGDPSVDGEEYVQVELSLNGTKDVLPFTPADLTPATRGKPATDAVGPATPRRGPRMARDGATPHRPVAQGPAGGLAAAVRAEHLAPGRPAEDAGLSRSATGSTPNGDPANRDVTPVPAVTGASGAASRVPAGQAVSTGTAGGATAGSVGPPGADRPATRTKQNRPAEVGQADALFPGPALTPVTGAGGEPSSGRKKQARGTRRTAPVSITIATTESDPTHWKIEARVGARVVLRSGSVSPARVWELVRQLDEETLSKAVGGILEEQRKAAQARADALAAELAQVRAELDALPGGRS